MKMSIVFCKTYMLFVYFLLQFSVCLCDFAKDCLAVHNHYRAIHGVPPLKLNANLTAVSQKWANHLARTGTFQHSRTKYGENLYMVAGVKNANDVEAAVKAWYKEIELYNPKEPERNWMATGHFTQLVWKNSKYLGCAIAKRNRSRYIVANYDPAGNFVGKYHENVLNVKKTNSSQKTKKA